jgi:uncharacterized protein (TIGR03067 family)
MRSTLLALLLSVSSVTLAPAFEKAPSGDLAKLQGRWSAKAGPRRNIAVELEVAGSRAQVRIKTPHGKTIEVQGEIKIDEKVEPHALDWVKFNGYDDQELPEIAAIYELRGDIFKVCNGGPNNNRPTEFKPGEGLLADLLEFQRIK